jgi:hypothetical protein
MHKLNANNIVKRETTMSQIAQFTIGGHSFTVTLGESCMFRTVTLIVTVKCGRDAKTASLGIPIFAITEGDHVWNMLVQDNAQKGPGISLEPCIPYLRICAGAFTREHPDPLVFTSPIKAWRFSEDNLGWPLRLRGKDYPYFMSYPGS